HGRAEREAQQRVPRDCEVVEQLVGLLGAVDALGELSECAFVCEVADLAEKADAASADHVLVLELTGDRDGDRLDVAHCRTIRFTSSRAVRADFMPSNIACFASTSEPPTG